MKKSYEDTLERLLQMGLCPMAIKRHNKKPFHKWKDETIAKAMFLKYKTDCYGLRMGDQSLQCLDIDSKNHDDPQGMLKQFFSMLKKQGFDFNNVIVQETVNKGAHIIYRADTLKKSVIISRKRSGERLIETRGQGAYIVMWELEKFNNIDRLTTISPEMEKMLLNTAKAFDESISKSDNVFTQFNETTSCVDLLVSYGWSIVVDSDDRWVEMLRPGETTSTSSGKVFKDSNRAYIFSTSTNLLSETLLSPADIEIELRYSGNKKAFAVAQGGSVNTDHTHKRSDVEYFTSYTTDDLIEYAKTNPSKMMLGGLWLKDENLILFAETNIGKSVLAQQIGLNLALGRSMHDIYLPNEMDEQNVMYFDFELSKRQMGNRLGEEYANIPTYKVMKPTSNLAMGSFQVLSAIESELKKGWADVVIIDNITAIQVDNEKAAAGGELLQKLNSLRTEYNVSMCIVTHTTKRPKYFEIGVYDLAGSSQLSNQIDNLIALGYSSRDKNERYLKQLKVRDTDFVFQADNVLVMNLAKIDGTLKFTITDTIDEKQLIGERVDRTERDSEIQALADKGISSRQIAETLGLGKSRVAQIIKNNRSGM